MSRPVAAHERPVASPDEVIATAGEPTSAAPASDDVPPLRPPLPGPAPAADTDLDVSTPLPTEVRLQDLAARQRSSTADLRRSIRDVIERLEDEEPPSPRRRGKKARR
jgi:hypothetical protein